MAILLVLIYQWTDVDSLIKVKGAINEKRDNWLRACYPPISRKIFQKYEKAEEESISAKQCCLYTHSGYSKLMTQEFRALTAPQTSNPRGEPWHFAF